MRTESRVFRNLASDDVEALLSFFGSLTEQDRCFFHPHLFDARTAQGICHNPGKDVFAAGFQHSEVKAYGMLRGWNDGFEVPRLGIATGPSARGQGWSDGMMDYLHQVARDAGALRVELKVDVRNTAAIALYRRHGYQFPEKFQNAPETIAWRSL
jgi:ribosomal protein S18 acetylase RimI-like enzyme